MEFGSRGSIVINIPLSIPSMQAHLVLVACAVLGRLPPATRPSMMGSSLPSSSVPAIGRIVLLESDRISALGAEGLAEEALGLAMP